MSSSTDESVAKKMKLDSRLVWVDLEMTGLDESKEQIMEAAVLVTDGELDVVAEGPNLILNVESSVLDSMNEWCTNQHGQSGLTEQCRKSKVTLDDAHKQLLEFVQKHTDKGKAPLAGNSIGTDKRFLRKYMPEFVDHLHYRIVDVSTVKELCRMWHPKEFAAAPKKAISHRALDDIKESLAELQYYRGAIFKEEQSS